MEFLRDISFEEVFEGWKASEINNPDWVYCATQIKGWPDWESWRRHTAQQINATERKWQLYQFSDPINQIPQMLIGPFSGWQSRFQEKNVSSFEDLLENPIYFEEFKKHKGISSIMEGLPFDTQFIGLIREDINKIVCIEGHHRATSISISKKLKKKIDFTNSKIQIALSRLNSEEVYILDEILERGTSNETL